MCAIDVRKAFLKGISDDELARLTWEPERDANFELTKEVAMILRMIPGFEDVDPATEVCHCTKPGAGCKDAQDSLEHYAMCPVVHEYGRRHLNLNIGSSCRQRGHFLVSGLNVANLVKEELARRAIWVYAVYRAFLYCRHNAGERFDVVELMEQFARIGVRSHTGASKALDYAWARSK